MANISSKIVSGKYVVGLTWRPLLTAGSPVALALARARDEKAKLYCQSGTSRFVGLAFGVKKTGKKNHQLFSLAAMAGRAFPGDAIFCLPLGSLVDNVAYDGAEGWWVGTTTNSMPTLDLFVSSAEEARSIVEKAHEKNSSASLHGDVDLGLVGCQHLDLYQLVSFENDSSILRDSTKKLPVWIYPVSGLLTAYLCYSQLYPMYTAYQEALNPKPSLPAVDAVKEWTQATNEFLKKVNKPLGSDLSVLRAAIYGLPPLVGGWGLSSVSCVMSQQWQCKLSYKRPVTIDSVATNRSFEDARPKDWKVTWKSATDVIASVDVIGTVTTPLVASVHLPLLSYYQVDTYSEFQDLSKIFSKVTVSDLTRADIPVPKAPDGQPISRPDPSKYSEVLKGDVTFSGPLRNVELIEQTKAPVFWREVAFARLKTEKPNLQQSEFNADFRGEIYAKTR